MTPDAPTPEPTAHAQQGLGETVMFAADLQCKFDGLGLRRG